MGGVNPVGGAWTPSSYGSGSGSAYPLNLDAMLLNSQRRSSCFNPHQTATPAMTVSLDAGYVFNGATLTEIAAQTTGTITAPVGNARIDRVVVDRSSGAVSVVTGTPAGSPTPPAIPAGKWPIAQVLLQTTSTTITNSMITDERALEGGVSPAVVNTFTAPQTFSPTSGAAFAITTGGITFGAAGGAVNDCEVTVAAAATLAIGASAGRHLLVTGTTAISAGDMIAAGVERVLELGAASTLINSSTFQVSGGINFTGNPLGGDIVLAYSEGSGSWRLNPHKADGTSVVGASGIHNSTFINSAGATTLVAAAGVDWMDVLLQAPGGGVGGKASGISCGSGGAGAFAAVRCKVTGGVTLILMNGTGGAAGGSGGTSGGDGGNSTLSSSSGGSITLGGGKGGTHNGTGGAAGTLVGFTGSISGGFVLLNALPSIAGATGTATSGNGAASNFALGGVTGTSAAPGTLGSGGGSPTGSGTAGGAPGGDGCAEVVW